MVRFCGSIKRFPEIPSKHPLEAARVRYCGAMTEFPVFSGNKIKNITLHGIKAPGTVIEFGSCPKLKEIDLSFCTGVRLIKGLESNYSTLKYVTAIGYDDPSSALSRLPSTVALIST